MKPTEECSQLKEKIQNLLDDNDSNIKGNMFNDFNIEDIKKNPLIYTGLMTKFYNSCIASKDNDNLKKIFSMVALDSVNLKHKVTSLDMLSKLNTDYIDIINKIFDSDVEVDAKYTNTY